MHYSHVGMVTYSCFISSGYGDIDYIAVYCAGSGGGDAQTICEFTTGVVAPSETNFLRLNCQAAWGENDFVVGRLIVHGNDRIVARIAILNIGTVTIVLGAGENSIGFAFDKSGNGYAVICRHFAVGDSVVFGRNR